MSDGRNESADRFDPKKDTEERPSHSRTHITWNDDEALMGPILRRKRVVSMPIGAGGRCPSFVRLRLHINS